MNILYYYLVGTPKRASLDDIDDGIITTHSTKYHVYHTYTYTYAAVTEGADARACGAASGSTTYACRARDVQRRLGGGRIFIILL